MRRLVPERLQQRSSHRPASASLDDPPHSAMSAPVDTTASTPPAAATREQVRAVTRAHRTKRDAWAASVVLLDALLFVGLSGVAVAPVPLAARILAGTALGVVIARLFILGHDACHNALFSQRPMNVVAGRLLFLPSLTPFSLWEVGHNVAHHGYTNLRGRDHVWVPLAKAEYDRLPAWRRAAERLYRRPGGQGLYYLVELWWKRLLFPSTAHVAARRHSHTVDSALATAFAMAWVLAIAVTAARAGAGVVTALLVAVAWPFAVWNALMGFVIYVQHTHPEVAWFANRDEWAWFQAQVGSTPHVELPFPFSRVLHNIMEHTAHHLDMGVPHYGLVEAQRSLETSFGEVRAIAWSWRSFLDTTRRCRLYDYERHVWLDFDGRVTAAVDVRGFARAKPMPSLEATGG
jgi:omega-6 fatty acid desaturase (delta-12 desaturase)